jgi:dienelactone hydrolase
MTLPPPPYVRRKPMRLAVSAAGLMGLAACQSLPPQAAKMETAAISGEIGSGVSPAIRLSGLQPEESVRLHAIRDVEIWRPDETGAWRPRELRLHAWADFRANGKGVVDLDRTAPSAGLWRSAGSMPVYWAGLPSDRSGAPMPDGLASSPADRSRIRLAAVRGETVFAETSLAIRPELADVAVEDVRTPDLVGAFAAPREARKLPLVIVLHGSEGSPPGAAREAAALFARQGFAAFALAYYAPNWTPNPGVPTEAINVPIERIAAVRDWAATRPEADAEKVGLRGVSKGAEFALVAAAHYDWIDAVVACVPTDRVWQGFGREPSPGEQASTWSIGGAPLPYIRYAETFGQFSARIPGSSAEDWHSSSLAAADDATMRAARIPVESISARVLLIAGDKDEVWPSGLMARRIVEARARAGLLKRTQAEIFPGGNHQICGPGDSPTQPLTSEPIAPGAADPIAVGEAGETAWRKTTEFLAASLRKN